MICLLVALGGLGYLAYRVIAEKILEARIDTAMPKVCEAVRAERASIVEAIERYKVHFGVYPPDHVLSRQPLVVDPVTNTLLYELAGVTFNRAKKTLQVDGLEPAEEKFVKSYLQCDRFRNSGETRSNVFDFLKMDSLPARQLHDDPDVFALGFYAPYEAVGPALVWEFDATPWRYVSTAPTNNPGKFDLWIEVKTRHRRVLIGNWKSVE